MWRLCMRRNEHQPQHSPVAAACQLLPVLAGIRGAHSAPAWDPDSAFQAYPAAEQLHCPANPAEFVDAAVNDQSVGIHSALVDVDDSLGFDLMAGGAMSRSVPGSASANVLGH